ncbi:MAG: EpsG family protein [Bacteroides sp.]|nr:EpsG family protein [Prevotella sp.]MCM1408566.1 EpsG family protein [Treponema brennaborense]MCM1468945.1 EpsG family protein [Bacteroides sp.]
MIFIGFRGFIQTDWFSYYKFFEKTPSLLDNAFIDYVHNSEFEVGFTVFSSFIKLFSANYFVFQFVNYLIEFIVLYTLFRKYLGRNFLFGFLFYYIFGCLTMSINLLRNSKAILIFIISLKYIERHQFFRYLFFNCIGCLFHVTAILYIPLYFLLSKEWNGKLLIFLFIIGNVFFFFHIEWIKILFQIFAPFCGQRIGSMMEFYTKSKIFASSYGFSIGFIERFMTFLLIYHYRKKIYALNKTNIIFINCLFCYVYVYLFTSEMAVLTDRLPLLFVFSYWFVYPQIYESLNSINIKRLFLLILMLYSIIKLIKFNYAFVMYDNALFTHLNYNDRSYYLKKYAKFLIERRGG